jgi:feruloyl esterase
VGAGQPGRGRGLRVPDIDQVATNTFYHAWNVRVNSRPDGSPILTADKIPGLHRAVLAACGRDNGRAGDMLIDPRNCDFDPPSIVCQGADRPTCLSAEQARVVRLIYRGPADEHGHLLSPGDMPKGSELGWVGSMVPQNLGDKVTEATAGD